MATEFYLMAGNEIIDQVDVSSGDRKFMDVINSLKERLSSEARQAFSLVSEYEMHPDDGEPLELSPCSDSVIEEIESNWFAD